MISRKPRTVLSAGGPSCSVRVRRGLGKNRWDVVLRVAAPEVSEPTFLLAPTYPTGRSGGGAFIWCHIHILICNLTLFTSELICFSVLLKKEAHVCV